MIDRPQEFIAARAGRASAVANQAHDAVLPADGDLNGGVVRRDDLPFLAACFT
jgi:hypothetical protein